MTQKEMQFFGLCYAAILPLLDNVLTFRREMIVSSLFSWLEQIRYTTVNYDGSILEQRKFAIQADRSANVIKRIRSVDNNWRPLVDEKSIDEAFAFLSDEHKQVSDSKSPTKVENISNIVQRKRHSLHYIDTEHYNKINDVNKTNDCLNQLERHTLPQIKHGKIERLETLFNESCQELKNDVRSSVKEVFIPDNVRWWMNMLLISCENEPEFDSFEIQSCNFNKAVVRFPVARKCNNVATTTKINKTENDNPIIKDHVVDNCTKVMCNGVKYKISHDEVVAFENSSLVVKDHQGNLKRTIIENIIEIANLGNRELVAKSDSNKAKLYIEKLPSPIGKNRKLLQIFFRKRLTREDLERRGIYKDEPIFGNTLEHLHIVSSSPIPTFVKCCIEHLERVDNLTTAGLYRTSGNAAVIQTIRINVDLNRMHILDTYRDDPEVLAGALKMFFRELKRSLIGERDFERLVKIYRNNSSQNDKLQAISNEIQAYSEPYRETLLALSKHLLNVARYETQNKMNIRALSICWGPSVISFLTDHSLRDGMIELIELKNAVFEMILKSYAMAQVKYVIIRK